MRDLLSRNLLTKLLFVVPIAALLAGLATPDPSQAQRGSASSAGANQPPVTGLPAQISKKRPVLAPYPDAVRMSPDKPNDRTTSLKKDVVTIPYK